MKTTLALVVLALALSLCNLTGRRGNNNANTNAAPSPGEMAESSPTPSPETQPSKRNDNAERTVEIRSIPPPPTPEELHSVQKAAPPTSAAPGGPASSMPGANQNSAASVPPPPPKTISGGVLNGKAIRLVQPAYPAIARAAHASGQVTVRVLVDENGNVVSATALSGHILLQASAAAAARRIQVFADTAQRTTC